jgi:hypothetical protein
MEDLRRYLEECVEPTIADFEKNPASVRLAFLACVATFHCVDYLAHPRSPRRMRQKWQRASKAFKTVDDVAHAFKHVKSGNPAKPNLKAKEVASRQGAFQIGAFQADAFDVGAVTLENDTSVNILATVKEAAAFVRDQLNDGHT